MWGIHRIPAGLPVWSHDAWFGCRPALDYECKNFTHQRRSVQALLGRAIQRKNPEPAYSPAGKLGSGFYFLRTDGL